MSLGVGAASTPEIFAQTVPGVPDPDTALNVSQGGGTSALVSGAVVYLAVDFGGVLGRTTAGSSLVSTTVTAAGNVLTTSVTVPSTAVTTGVYAATVNPPYLLGTVSGSTVTLATGVAAGALTVAQSGTTLQLTINNVAASGPVPGTLNQATTVCYTAPAATANTPAPAPTAVVGNICVANTTGGAAAFSLLVVPSGATAWNPAWLRFANTTLDGWSTDWLTQLGLPLTPGMTVQAAQSTWNAGVGAIAVNLDGVEVQ